MSPSAVCLHCVRSSVNCRCSSRHHWVLSQACNSYHKLLSKIVQLKTPRHRFAVPLGLVNHLYASPCRRAANTACTCVPHHTP